MITRRFLLTLALLAVVACTLTTSASATTGGPLFFDLSGPTAVAPGQTAAFNVTASGGPSGNVSYSVVYYIEGTNTSGGSPLSGSPGRTTGNHTILRINITAPTLEQTLTLVVTLDATPREGPRRTSRGPSRSPWSSRSSSRRRSTTAARRPR